MIRFRLLAICLSALALSAPATAEVVQQGDLRVAFVGKFAPTALPRQGTAPLAVSVGGTIATTTGAVPPQLQKIAIAINRAARFDPRGLPVCSYAEIQPATTAAAMAACGAAKVGEGSFAAKVVVPEQTPFPSQGRIVAFNGRVGGRPAVLAHVYGTAPVPLSYTIVLRLRPSHGTFGTVLEADLPAVTSDVAYVTGISLSLDRRFRYRGALHGYLSAGCPAPPGFPGATFPLARASFAFAGGETLAKTLSRNCRARG
jgi:hypothetical protein